MGGDPRGLDETLVRGIGGAGTPGSPLHRLEGLEEIPKEGFDPPCTKGGRRLFQGVAAAGGVLSMDLHAKLVKKVGGTMDEEQREIHDG